jgi:SAM-dependent methyltransferase
MLEEEAKWIGSLVPILIEKNAFPLLNVGSSTLAFRKSIQPFINKDIFEPLERSGASIIHLDLKQGEGIDMVGDLCDENLLGELIKKNIKTILCSNVLEHVKNPGQICQRLFEVLQPGGIIIVTVPYLFPYHNDPIDTMFRPDIEQLSALFPQMKLISGIKIESDQVYLTRLLRRRKELLIFLMRLLTPFYKPKKWWLLFKYLRHFFHSNIVSCVVLEK